MTTYIVTDGPLVANMMNPDGSTFNGGTVPTGTELYGTGNTRGVWVEASSPYQKSKGVTAWYHRDYIEEVNSATSVPSLQEQREAKAAKWFWSVAGRGIDVDNVPYNQPKQCVDVSKHFAINAYNAPFGAYGNGKDVARSFATRLPGWTGFEYKPGMKLQALDVLSYGDPYGVDPETGEVYGHTEVQIKDDVVPNVAYQDGFNKDTVVKAKRRDSTEGLIYVARPPFVSSTVPQGASATQYHTVTSGDTLWSISVKYGLTLSALQKLNPKVDPMNIRPNDKIRVV